jgi:hypothetical protein
MQPVRVIIAAIFFVIGALIVIPAFLGGKNGTSNASDSPSATTSGPSATATSPTPTSTKSPSRSPSKSPTATKTPTKSPSASASHAPTTTKPSATPSATKPSTSPTTTRSVPPAVPGTPSLVPLKVTYSKVDCPKRLVTVKVVNNDLVTTQGYSIVRDGSIFLADQLGPKASRTSEMTLKEDKSTTVRVTQDGTAKATHVYKANCAAAAPGRSASPSQRTRTLPYTGNDRSVMVARLATGGAALLTGGIILWWGGLWPSRKDKMLG